ncbi:low temperature requirement protein A [Dactylosporangium darangshiense]|uniref:Uncharacterized protein n=1 Tax=Dactylosporangium darangshiense TaxID=579108 RepID=A0ABP8DD57_9ACTN
MATPAAEERHATWLELFFGLVIVAAVAQLAHLLHDGVTFEKVLIFAFAYYAMWSIWTAFTLYANVTGTRTRQRAMLAAMFGIAVMASSSAARRTADTRAAPRCGRRRSRRRRALATP